MYFCRFKVHNILSQGSPQWTQKRGHITAEILQETVEKHLQIIGHKKEDIFVTVCGPTPFTNLTEKLLYDVGMTKEQMHLFLG